jgi:precorrin-4/cobalt-precorrin-4 C11-methyltransferase
MKNNFRPLRLSSFLFFFALIMLTAGIACAAPGTLSLVSMGTGDPDNMTIRAQKAIAAADLFFTMGGRNHHPELIKDRPVHNAEHGLFGKEGAKPRRSPEEAEKLRAENRKIIREAVAAGKNVVILDNGDPSIFGPQIGYMEEFADLNPVIVPGISSFNAANAALQTSVVRGNARAVMLTSGSLADGRDEFLARTIKDGVTLVFFMVRDLDNFISTMSTRLPGDTAVAIVANAGSASEEKVIRATIGTLGPQVKGAKLGAFLLYIGDAVGN